MRSHHWWQEAGQVLEMFSEVRKQRREYALKPDSMESVRQAGLWKCNVWCCHQGCAIPPVSGCLVWFLIQAGPPREWECDSKVRFILLSPRWSLLYVVTLAAALPTLKGATYLLVVTYPCLHSLNTWNFKSRMPVWICETLTWCTWVLAAFLVSVMVTMAPCASLLVPGVWDLPTSPCSPRGLAVFAFQDWLES